MYYIYHIPNVKIGCTHNLIERFAGRRHIQYEVLETYNDIKIASQREIELQIQYGYKVDNTPYKTIVEKNKNLNQRNKISQSLKGRKRTWNTHSAETARKISESNLGKSRGKGISKNKGKQNRLECGRLYKDISTGFVGYRTDIINHFNIPDALITHMIKRNKPMSRGKNKGLHIICVQ